MYLLFPSVIFKDDAVCVDGVVNSIGVVDFVVVVVVSGVVDVVDCVDVIFVVVGVVNDVSIWVIVVVFNGTVISSIGVDFNNILVGEVDFVECTLDTIVNINIFKSKCHSLFFFLFFFCNCDLVTPFVWQGFMNICANQ